MLTEKWLFRLLRWAARYLGGRGHSMLATHLFRAAGDSQSFEHARAAWLVGDVDGAKALLAELLAARPNHPEGNNMMGAICLQADQVDAAEAHFLRALAARPTYAAARNNLGNVCQARNDWPGAIRCYREALECDANYVEALINLGGGLNAIGQYVEAERHCRRAVELAPDFAGAWSNLGSALFSQGRGGEAVAACREALRLEPTLAEASINLYLILQDAGLLVGVVDYYEARLKKNPDDYLAHVRIAQALQAQHRWDDGLDRLQQALAIRPDAIDAMTLLGHNLAHAGDAQGAIEKYRRALEFGPNPGAHASMVFDLLYTDEASGTALRDAYVEWAELYAQYVARESSGTTRKDGRPLRVGYVSMDFAKHSVAYFMEPILEQHDRDAVFVVCYSTLLQPDAVTERLRGMSDLWRDVSLSSLDEMEAMIREDEIDILVDLSGYTSGSRLTLFARKPAPIQVTYLGHPATTGVAAIDYRISDDVADPPGMTEDHYTEQLWRLPGCFLTYLPAADAPPVAEPPSLTNGHVTFGSFNNLLKVSPRVIEAWARILRAVPSATLLLKGFAFNARHGRERVTAEFARHGISESRLRLQDWRAAANDHLTAYGEIDIALDPFPYNGTTTTCEAFWMGVPVVTLVGDRHSCRVGASLLRCVGLDDLTRASVDDYVAAAVALAADGERLRELRASLRERMRASPLMDHAGFARKLEVAYLAMWRAHAPAAAATTPSPVPTADLRLHIGGHEARPGWKILNVTAGPQVDFVGDIRDLSLFRPNSVAEIYASHVLEHVDQNAMPNVLRGLRRILRKPGGRLMISVPDLEALCRQFFDAGLGAAERIHVMRMMFGGQVDAHDYHYIGLYFELLSDLLTQAGFRNVRRVESFGLFADTSDYAPYGQRISLNVVAEV